MSGIRRGRRQLQAGDPWPGHPESGLASARGHHVKGERRRIAARRHDLILNRVPWRDTSTCDSGTDEGVAIISEDRKLGPVARGLAQQFDIDQYGGLPALGLDHNGAGMISLCTLQHVLHLEVHGAPTKALGAEFAGRVGSAACGLIAGRRFCHRVVFAAHGRRTSAGRWHPKIELVDGTPFTAIVGCVSRRWLLMRSPRNVDHFAL